MQTRWWDESGKALDEHKWFDDEIRCVVDAPGPCPRTRQDGKSGSEDHLPLAGVLPHPLVANRNIVDGVFRTAGVLVFKVGQDAPPVFSGPGRVGSPQQTWVKPGSSTPLKVAGSMPITSAMLVSGSHMHGAAMMFASCRGSGCPSARPPAATQASTLFPSLRSNRSQHGGRALGSAHTKKNPSRP